MGQVGHADSKMTLDVYAQLEQRAKRDHGASLARLISAARIQAAGTCAFAETAGMGAWRGKGE